MIDNAKGLYAPCMKLTMFELVLYVNQAVDKVSIQGRTLMNCSYLNPIPSKWEPILETSGLNFCCKIIEGNNVTVNIATSEDTEGIYLNVSDEMVSLFFN